jgi:hypothetical protein
LETFVFTHWQSLPPRRIQTRKRPWKAEVGYGFRQGILGFAFGKYERGGERGPWMACPFGLRRSHLDDRIEGFQEVYLEHRA